MTWLDFLAIGLSFLAGFLAGAFAVLKAFQVMHNNGLPSHYKPAPKAKS